MDDSSDMQRRVEAMEVELDRLRQQLRDAQGLEHDPPAWFDPTEFRQVLRGILMRAALLWLVAGPLLVLASVYPFLPARVRAVTDISVGPVPLMNIGGSTTGTPGIGLGIIAIGGVAVGVIAMGGGAVGGVAIGGGACGLFAYGGGAIGVIAVGGGAFGYIAIGGGAYGRYALGERAHGRAALGLNRQDEEAVDFFRRWIPRLNRAVTRPMEVVMAEGVTEGE